MTPVGRRAGMAWSTWILPRHLRHHAPHSHGASNRQPNPHGVQRAEHDQHQGEAGEHRQADARRALSDGFERVNWPPRVGARIHYNSGWPHTSWTGEVRGLVDIDGRRGVAVVWRTNPAAGKSRWYCLEWAEVTVATIRYGALPRALTQRS